MSLSFSKVFAALWGIATLVGAWEQVWHSCVSVSTVVVSRWVWIERVSSQYIARCGLCVH